MLNNYLWCLCSGIKYLSDPGIFSPQVSSSKVGSYCFFLDVAANIAKNIFSVKQNVITNALPIIFATFFTSALFMISILEDLYDYACKTIQTLSFKSLINCCEYAHTGGPISLDADPLSTPGSFT